MEKKPKILLIDDDPDFVEVTKRILESKPYQVVVAVNGKDGLEKARKEKPDLILLDILMPVTDGFGFAEKFSKERSLSAIPVLALTSFSTSLGEPFGFKVAEYIRKPVGPRDLIDKVEKHLKRAEEKAMGGVAKGGAKKRKAQAKTMKKPAKKAAKAATKKTRK
jgi:two-component system alkaline phosphatase synthesis response regulator PhoP